MLVLVLVLSTGLVLGIGAGAESAPTSCDFPATSKIVRSTSGDVRVRSVAGTAALTSGFVVVDGGGVWFTTIGVAGSCGGILPEATVAAVAEIGGGTLAGKPDQGASARRIASASANRASRSLAIARSTTVTRSRGRSGRSSSSGVGVFSTIEKSSAGMLGASKGSLRR